MSKIYFIVGSEGTGKTVVATSLRNTYNTNNQLAVIKTIGVAERIGNSGTKHPDETLDTINSILAANAGEDAVIFIGWRIPDHINEIYSAHSSATFIFTDSSLDNPTNRIHLERFVTSQEMLTIVARQKTNIDSFIAINSLTLSYQPVNASVFNTDYSLNLDSAGSIAISLLGSI
jgi:hypothetical protein